MLRIFTICAFLAVTAFPASAQMPDAGQPPAQPQAQPQTQAAPPAEIWIAYTAPEHKLTYGGQKYCHIRIKLLNRAPEILKRLEARFIWEKWNNPVVFTMFMPDQSNTILYRLPGVLCDSLEAKPKITVKTCLMEGVTVDECISMIRIKGWDEF